MEQLLAVEVLTNNCCCCLQPLLRSQRNASTAKNDRFQQVFTQLFGEELPAGLICEDCSTNLQRIIDFKEQIQTLRLGSELQTYIKLEDIAMKDERDFQDAFSDPLIEEVEPEVVVEQAEMKPKHTSLMREHGAKFVEDDIAKITKSPKVSCSLCDKILTATAFRVHMKRHKGTHQHNFMCEICSRKFSFISQLVVHRRTHNKEKPFQCDHCPSKFFSCKKNLIAHLRTMHLDIRRPNVMKECEICGKKVISLNFQRHMKKNHPNGDINGLRIDPETELYHCKACDGQFRTINLHENHFCAKNTNDGPSALICLICHNRSKTRLEATKHIQEVHAERIDETRWKCLVCNTVVAAKILLHIESVHASIGSKCQYCYKKLKNRRCLKNHIYVMHKNGSEVRRMKRKLSKSNKSIV